MHKHFSTYENLPTFLLTGLLLDFFVTYTRTDLLNANSMSLSFW